MKVLCVVSDNDLPESRLILSLFNQGVDLRVIIDPSSRYVEEYRSAGITVDTLKFKSRIDFKAVSFIRDIMCSDKIDIVHCFSKVALSNSLIAGTGLGVKSIGYRGIVGNLSLFDPGSWITFLNPSLNKAVCVCHAIEVYLTKFRVLRGKTRTIHKGHKVAWYDPSKVVSKSELGIPKDSFLLSCVCNIRPRKGISDLVRALEFLPDQVHLLLVGSIKDKALERLLENSPVSSRIHCIGFQVDAWRYGAAGDVFVMPSTKREGLPKGVIEAMAQGMPAIVTRIGGMPEIVENGLSGFVIDPGKPEIIAEIVKKYLEDEQLLQAHGNQAKSRIEKNFNISETVAAYGELYEELMVA
jgi:glycosyltransferase involved in cell wall biosynthesis